MTTTTTTRPSGVAMWAADALARAIEFGEPSIEELAAIIEKETGLVEMREVLDLAVAIDDDDCPARDPITDLQVLADMSRHTLARVVGGAA